MHVSVRYPNPIFGKTSKNDLFSPMLELSRDYPKTENPLIQPAPVKKSTSTRSTTKDGTDTPKAPVKRRPSR